MSDRSRIVILNGVGSAGKSSIAKALQTIVERPYLHVQMDTFMDMLPDRYQESPEGFTYETVYDGEDKPCVVITTGSVGFTALQGMRHAIAAMAYQGNNLVVDDVMCDGGEMAEYLSLLAPFDLMTVAVKAPLDVLEARERQRGDRLIGLARWQFDRVHRNITYDFEVDTAVATPLECATLIQKRFAL
jgi:chloramphenicol 3-O phosphotransferase